MHKDLKTQVQDLASEILQGCDKIRDLCDGQLEDLVDQLRELLESQWDTKIVDPDVRASLILLNSVKSIASTVAQSTRASYEFDVERALGTAAYNGLEILRGAH